MYIYTYSDVPLSNGGDARVRNGPYWCQTDLEKIRRAWYNVRGQCAMSHSPPNRLAEEPRITRSS